MVTSLITDEMIEEFNEILIKEGSILRLQKSKLSSIGSVDIILQADQNIQFSTLGVSDKFYKKLDSFFRPKGVWELSFNNTGTSFWCFKYE